jgi:hypothetical protein
MQKKKKKKSWWSGPSGPLASGRPWVKSPLPWKKKLFKGLRILKKLSNDTRKITRVMPEVYKMLCVVNWKPHLFYLLSAYVVLNTLNIRPWDKGMKIIRRENCKLSKYAERRSLSQLIHNTLRYIWDTVVQLLIYQNKNLKTTCQEEGGGLVQDVWSFMYS